MSQAFITVLQAVIFKTCSFKTVASCCENGSPLAEQFQAYRRIESALASSASEKQFLKRL